MSVGDSNYFFIYVKSEFKDYLSEGGINASTIDDNAQLMNELFFYYLLMCILWILVD